MAPKNPWLGNHHIHNIVGRCHVGDDVKKVESYFISRIDKEAWKLKTEDERNLILEALREAHRLNQELYRVVMG